MKKKKNISIFSLLIMCVIFLFASSCEKDDDDSPSSNNPTNGKTTAVFNPDITYGTMTDQDGNVYKTVTIGTQTWMAENLRTTKYNDGTAIANVTDSIEWGNSKTGAYCNYNNTTDIDTIATYGRLYNWYAVNTGKLAPIGWHVPTADEWTKLTDDLGSGTVAGGKLKETGTNHWNSPNTGATNETGFTALPGGCHNLFVSFCDVGNYGHWWSATEYNETVARSRDMYYLFGVVYKAGASKKMGFSVRCLMD